MGGGGTVVTKQPTSHAEKEKKKSESRKETKKANRWEKNSGRGLTI